MNKKEYAAILALSAFAGAAPLCVFAQDEVTIDESSAENEQATTPAQTYCYVHVKEYWAGQTSPLDQQTFQVKAGESFVKAFDRDGYKAVLTDESLITTGTDAAVVTLTDIAQDTTIYVVYVPQTAKYTVVQYFFDLDGQKVKTEQYEMTGTIDALTEVTPPAVDGYSVSLVDQEYVRADGTTVVNINYQVARYAISYHSLGSFVDAEEISYDDLATWSTNEQSKRTGYKFAGWSYEENGAKITSWSKDDLLAHAKDGIIHLYALWTPDTVNYTVRYWQQNTTDDVNASDENKTYAYVNSVVRQALTESTVAPSVGDKLKGTLTDSSSEWYCFVYNDANTTKNLEVLPDGSTTLNVYYDRAHVKYVFYLLKDMDNEYLSSSRYSTDNANVGDMLGEYEGLYKAGFDKLDTDYQWRVYNKSTYDTPPYSVWAELGSFQPVFGKAMTLENNTFTINFYTHDKVDYSKTKGYYYELYDGNYRYGYMTGDLSNHTSVTFQVPSKGYHYEYYTQVDAGNTIDDAKAVYLDEKYLTEEFWHNNGTKVNSTPFSLYYSNGNALLLAFDLNIYDFELNYNGSNMSETFQVKYTSPLDEQWAPDVFNAINNPKRPADLPDYMEFAGWYLDKDYSVPFTATTMPANNVVIYAKWQPKTFTITVYDQVNAEYSKTLLAGSQLMGLVIPDNGSAVFQGWYLDADYDTPLAPDKIVVEDLDIYAKWKVTPTAKTTIRYVDESGIDLIAPEEVTGVPGQFMAAVAKAIDGYSAIDMAKDVLMSDGSEIFLVYKQVTPSWYQVEYVLEDGTLIASDPVENITDLDTFRLYANVPEGYLLVNPDDQDKEINAAGFSKDESAPTKIKIVVKAPVKPSWYQVEYILEDGTVIASDPIESVTDEESVHITANIPSGYELVNDTDKEKDVDTTDFSKDETAPTKIQIPVKAEIIPSWYQVEYVLEDGTVIKTEPIVKVMDEESVHVIANVPDGYELVNGTDKEKDVDTTDFSKDETAPTKIQIPVKAEIIPSWYQVEYILEDGTVIKTEPIVKVMDEESVHVIANVPDGYELVNDADAEKDVDTADFSNDETAPTIIQIPVKAEIIPSWYQVEYVLEDGTVIKAEPIVKVMDEESVHVIANVPDGYELVNDTDAEKDVDTANFSNDENAPTVIQIPIKAEIIPSWYQVEYVTEDGTVVASDPIVRIMDEESVHVTANVPDGYELVNDADAAKDVDTAGFSNDETAPTIIQIPVKAEIIPSWYQVEYILEDGTVIKTEPIVKVMDEESVHVIANVPDGYELVDAADLEKDVDTADFSNDETAPTKIQIVVKTPEAPKEDKDIDENKPEEKAGDDHNETKQNDEDEDKGKEEEGELNSDKEDRPEEKEGKKEPEKEPEAKSQTPAEKGKAAVPTAAGGLSFWNLLSSLSLSGFIVLNKRKK